MAIPCDTDNQFIQAYLPHFAYYDRKVSYIRSTGEIPYLAARHSLNFPATNLNPLSMPFRRLNLSRFNPGRVLKF